MVSLVKVSFREVFQTGFFDKTFFLKKGFGQTFLKFERKVCSENDRNSRHLRSFFDKTFFLKKGL